MKYQQLWLIYLFLVFLGCNEARNKGSVPSSSEGNPTEVANGARIPSELEGIWVLNKLNKKTIKNKTSIKNPTLEIIPAERKVLGNGGCNGYSGMIQWVGKNKIDIAIKETTKVQCDSSTLEKKYLKAISGEILSYKITGEKAIFYNDNTTLVFGRTPSK